MNQTFTQPAPYELPDAMKNVLIFALNCDNPNQEYQGIKNMLEYKGFDPELLAQGEGCYKGDAEVSYLYRYPSIHGSYDLIHKLCTFYHQESILYVDDMGQAYLKFIESGDTVFLGIMKPTTAGVAQADDYTLFNGVYYTIQEA